MQPQPVSTTFVTTSPNTQHETTNEGELTTAPTPTWHITSTPTPIHWDHQPAGPHPQTTSTMTSPPTRRVTHLRHHPPTELPQGPPHQCTHPAGGNVRGSCHPCLDQQLSGTLQPRQLHPSESTEQTTQLQLNSLTPHQRGGCSPHPQRQMRSSGSTRRGYALLRCQPGQRHHRRLSRLQRHAHRSAQPATTTWLGAAQAARLPTLDPSSCSTTTNTTTATTNLNTATRYQHNGTHSTNTAGSQRHTTTAGSQPRHNNPITNRQRHDQRPPTTDTPTNRRNHHPGQHDDGLCRFTDTPSVHLRPSGSASWAMYSRLFEGMHSGF